ncbi:MAG: hypothetical protein H6825_11550 [Planctomycetes bacterium]|nr:hypothetical protein [Planctomycetota bacterium]
MQDVLAALIRKGIGFTGYLDPSRPALLDAEHLVRLNYETYLFADTAGRDAFLADPLRFCGLLTDPVSKRRFRPRDDSPRAEHSGVTYYFEDESGRAMFVADPERFRLPGWTM